MNLLLLLVSVLLLCWNTMWHLDRVERGGRELFSKCCLNPVHWLYSRAFLPGPSVANKLILTPNLSQFRDLLHVSVSSLDSNAIGLIAAVSPARAWPGDGLGP